MSFWVYKCNTHNVANQGDWDYVFERNSKVTWGTTELKNVASVMAGDVLFAHQSDRQELVGLTEVLEAKLTGDKRFVIRKLEELRVSVSKLKKMDRRIKSIKALKPGDVASAYSIPTVEALHLLDTARAQRALQSLVAKKR